jgi:rubredoxin
MRLIDADALKKLRHDCIQGRIKFDGNEYDLIDKCPTIEAEPVRHGRWEWITEDIYRCTNCGTTNHVKEVMGKPDYNYCPECGADMRGRNNNGICEKS